MTEAQIHKAVVDHWRQAGLPDTLVATIPNMKPHGQPGLTPGLPDLLVIGDGGVAFIELKTDKGRLSQAQQDFRALCLEQDIPHFVTRGRDEPIQILRTLKVIR